ncbi:carbon-nitrogen hydrolase family protein [Agromyces indicus]|uniref:Carbon-nitrogen hydrolase family protein n=1 Tax=Agromyces indicus TaxID=758919 RepID=A0ABU1FI19_9MICO|nr:carbon-nitrogen hydrolase family protein [Agromyces indicus]MDR5691390.1 carbon-nitrogen hydrolase family protein [Agromyces indicus]
MTQSLIVALVQAAAEERFDVAAFGARMRELVHRVPSAALWVLPEFHLEPVSTHHNPESGARAIDDVAVAELAALARELGVWLVPGSIYERGDDGAIHNTALVFSPSGERVATYRKMFPWRPLEQTVPGDRFEVFEMPGYGRVGISICYDIWFPEHTRHLAWLGADLVLNLVQTATSDREQELAIVRGNAIMNQVWIASVNAAAPTGRGRSLVVDPNGSVRASSPDASEEILTAVVDFAATAQTRALGTAGVSRPWSQFRGDDAPIPLPLYGGRIEPSTWHPRSKENS